jgi:hypothetical protein
MQDIQQYARVTVKSPWKCEGAGSIKSPNFAALRIFEPNRPHIFFCALKTERLHIILWKSSAGRRKNQAFAARA